MKSGFSFLSAPPREELFVIAAMYGHTVITEADGSAMANARSRVWLMARDPDAPQIVGELRWAINDPQTGRPVHRIEPSPVASAELQPRRWVIELEDGTRVIAVPAPCVCGAGAVGAVGPSPDRHAVTSVRGDGISWLRFR